MTSPGKAELVPPITIARTETAELGVSQSVTRTRERYGGVPGPAEGG